MVGTIVAPSENSALAFDNEGQKPKKTTGMRRWLGLVSNGRHCVQKRSYNCGGIVGDIFGQGGEEGSGVEVRGWVQSIRRYGPLLFVNLRDSSGDVQLVWNEEKGEIAVAENLSPESVIEVSGLLRFRPKDMVNTSMKTGHVEIEVERFRILNAARQPLPVPVNRNGHAAYRKRAPRSSTARLKSRCLDLRSAEMQRNLRVRSKALHAARRHLVEDERFVEVETPILFKSTPEGAREFLVPTRSGDFFALTQSPQQYKQLLMAGGFERYFQVAKCFRDEGGRADRQPEFTQLDLEMSFASAADVRGVIERCLNNFCSEALKEARLQGENLTVQNSIPDWEDVYLPKVLRNFKVQRSLPLFPFDDMMERFGIDKPDRRFGLELQRVGNFPEACHGIRLSDIDLKGWLPSNKQWKELAAASLQGEFLERVCLCLVKVDAEGKWGKMKIEGGPSELKSQLLNCDKENREEVLRQLGCTTENFALLALSKNRNDAQIVLGRARLQIAEACGIMSDVKNEGKVDLFWVDNFPLFELDVDGNLQSCHHPFTMPIEKDLGTLKRHDATLEELLSLKAQHFDLICNGVEIGGGSVRIHDEDLQRHVFEHILRIDHGKTEQYFGHLLSGLGSGCPPHAGIALGIDRLMSLLLETQSIVDVIAFPKSNAGNDLLTGAPTPVSDKQLKEVQLKKIL